MNSLSPGVQKFVAAGLLLLVIGLVTSFLTGPFWHFYADKYAEISSLQGQVLRYQRLLAAKPAMEEEYKNLETTLAQVSLFLQGGRPSLVAANLQDFIHGTIQRHGAVLVSSQEFEGSDLASAQAIGLRLQFQASLDQLVLILLELENARPLLFVDNFTLAADGQGERSTAMSLGQSAMPGTGNALTITMNLVGYQISESP